MLANEQIMLRAVEPADVDYLFEAENNIDFWLVSNTSTPFSKRTLTDYANSVHDINTQGQFRFIITLLKSNLPIGMIDLFEYDSVHSRAGIGIVISDLKHRNKGVADSAIKLIIGYCKNVLKLRQLHCSILESNDASLALFQKNGFAICGFRKDWIKVKVNDWEGEHLLQLFL